MANSETQIPKAKLVGVRGDSWSRTLQFKNSGGSPIDITGWTVFFTVKSSPGSRDEDAVLQKTVTSHTNATGGLSAISCTAADTDNLQGDYYFDIQIKKSDGSIKTYLYGQIKFLEDTTRRTS